MRSKLVLFMMVLALSPAASAAEKEILLTISPVHVHQTADLVLSGMLGAGVSIETDRKWAVSVSWELHSSSHFAMDIVVPPDTSQLLNIFTLETVRVFERSEGGHTDIRGSINVGIGIESTEYYENEEDTEDPFDQIEFKRKIGDELKYPALAGLMVGIRTRWLGMSMEFQYRPKLYGVGDQNKLVHSGEFRFRIPLGSL